ncbi:kinase-like domain, phloem protein 2-like protein [Tanacetum coccineum]
MSSPSHDDLAHLKISLQNILSATNNFAHENLRGEDTCEKTYTGQLLWSGELINIFVRSFKKERTDRENLFWMDISLLSSLKHKNLISFVGFCDDNDEKIIIYKLPSRGSLNDYLSDMISLTWVRRLKICVALAHTLRYIHYDEPRDFSVIHRQLCSATILLNDDWEPKLYYFEYAMKIEASQRHLSFHTNNPVYVDGYGDPTYIETKSVNHNSVLYSFGIIMFELLCGRRAVLDDDQDNKYLASVAIGHYRKKKLDEIIDWDLWKQMESQSFNIFAEIAYNCLNEERSERPNIGEIVKRLEKALEFQLEHHNGMSKELAHLKVPLENILSATNNFAEENVIGEGGFGKRYKGELLWSGELINIMARRFNKGRNDAEQLLWMEISMLSSLKHKNLVSLVGFCDENDEKIIIIKHEIRGNLSNHLSNPMLLTWVRRLEICVGIAHALSYIHYDESLLHNRPIATAISVGNPSVTVVSDRFVTDIGRL